MNGYALREFLLEAVRPAVLSYFTPNSCVATTKVACEVLTWAGVKNRPLACSLLVANDVAKDVILSEHPVSQEEVAALVAKGGHAVEVIGSGERTDKGWDGHLVVTARFDDGDYLLDLSLDQARRSVWEINVHPVAALIPEYPLVHPVVARVTDSWVQWSPIRSTSFREHTDWRLNDLSNPIAGALIRELQAAA